MAIARWSKGRFVASAFVAALALLAAQLQPALALDPPFYVIAHMVNSAKTVHWAAGEGANAVEMDLRFSDTTGAPTEFRHGGVCDCTCTKGGVCKILFSEKNLASCEVSTAPATLMNAVAAESSKIALLFIDSKVDGSMSKIVLAKAGRAVITLLDAELFGKGYNGDVVVGAPDAKKTMAYIAGAAAAASSSRNKARYYFTYDGEGNDWDAVAFALSPIADRRVYGTGISACVPKTFYEALGKGWYNMEKGYLAGLTYIWTLDKTSSFEKYLSVGVNGIMTNFPKDLYNFAKSKNLKLATPGTSLGTGATPAAVAASCDCDYHPGGCTISKVPPPGSACRCVYKGAWTCGGYVVRCSNPSDKLCITPDASKAACQLGGGDCDAYK